METEAVNLIISKVNIGQFKLMVSPVHHYEIESIRDTLERVELKTLLSKTGHNITADLNRTRKRTEELTGFGFGIADAAHIAFAEQSISDFITCDDKLLKKCRQYDIMIWTGTPISFCEKENLK